MGSMKFINSPVATPIKLAIPSNRSIIKNPILGSSLKKIERAAIIMITVSPRMLKSRPFNQYGIFLPLFNYTTSLILDMLEIHNPVEFYQHSFHPDKVWHL